MPTILMIFGCRVVIYLNDHRPAHVHVQGGGYDAVFNLHSPGGPLKLRENYGFPIKSLGKLAVELAAQIRLLCEKWRAIHGHY